VRIGVRVSGIVFVYVPAVVFWLTLAFVIFAHFWINLIAALAKRDVYAAAEPPMTAPHRAGSKDAPFRGLHAGPIEAGHTRQALSLQPVGVASPWSKRLWPCFTVENIISAMLVSYVVGMAVIYFFPPV
jgi:hypothetical protein